MRFFIKLLEKNLKESDLPIVLDKAAHGDEAIEKATKKKYHAILMGLDLPLKNGWETTKVIRSLGIQTPIIGWSVQDKEFFIKTCLDAGMDDYVQIEGIDLLSDILDAFDRIGITNVRIGKTYL